MLHPSHLLQAKKHQIQRLLRWLKLPYGNRNKSQLVRLYVQHHQPRRGTGYMG